MNVAVSPDLLPTIRPGVLAFDAVAVAEREAWLEQSLLEVERRWRSDGPLATTPGSAGTGAVRAMYRAVGLDPTKRRPSSEALARRVWRGEGLPRVNTLVDVCNWCSLEFQLPYGVYDLARVEGDVELRLGRPGEEYAGIRKDVVHVAGRLTLADRLGPFGNPTSDSARTMVTTTTTAALVVVYAPRSLPADTVAGVLETTARRIERVTGGRARDPFIV